MPKHLAPVQVPPMSPGPQSRVWPGTMWHAGVLALLVSSVLCQVRITSTYFLPLNVNADETTCIPQDWLPQARPGHLWPWLLGPADHVPSLGQEGDPDGEAEEPLQDRQSADLVALWWDRIIYKCSLYLPIVKVLLVTQPPLVSTGLIAMDPKEEGVIFWRAAASQKELSTRLIRVDLWVVQISEEQFRKLNYYIAYKHLTTHFLH